MPNGIKLIKQKALDATAIALTLEKVSAHPLEMRVSRWCVKVKSRKEVSVLPLHPALAELLKAHRQRSVYVQATDFVFAGNSGKPAWGSEIVKHYLRPAAARAGIVGKVGWHTLRHSFSTLLGALGTDLKVQQSLLQHGNIATTMNVYTEAVSEQKREAANKVTAQLLPLVRSGTQVIQ